MTRWTPAADTLLRESYSTGGIRAARKVFPGKSDPVLYNRACNVLKLHRGHNRAWTDAEDAQIEFAWPYDSIAVIARALNRTRLMVYKRAVDHLGLPAGVPDGWEYLWTATQRTGYCNTDQLRRILAWARVPIKRSQTLHTGRRHRHMVEIEKVDAAVARWLKTETLKAAGRRYGVSGTTMKHWLNRAGVRLERAPGFRGKHNIKPEFRVDSAEIDRVARVVRGGLTLTDAAKRAGVQRITMQRWLEAAGIHVPARTRLWLVQPETVDRVAAERRARAGCRAGSQP